MHVTGTIFTDGRGAQMLYTKQSIDGYKIFFRTTSHATFHPVREHNGKYLIPSRNTSGTIEEVQRTHVTWGGWRYKNPQPFAGSVELFKEDSTTPRRVRSLIRGKTDGHVVCITEAMSGEEGSFRVFIAQAGPNGGTLPRREIYNTDVMRSTTPGVPDRTQIVCEMGFIRVNSGTWDDLLEDGEYEIRETLTEVRFRKK